MDTVLKKLWKLGQVFEAALVADDIVGAENCTEMTRSALKEASLEFSELYPGGVEHLKFTVQLIDVFLRFPYMWELVSVSIAVQFRTVDVD